MLSKLSQSIKHNLINIPGWRTNRKIIVFESDDWGSIRMPNLKVYQKLSTNSTAIKNNPYCKYDTLASQEDLSALFDVLVKHKDRNDNHPVITANTVVSNPNFEKIKASNFGKYYNEPFTETLKAYYPKNNPWSIWKEGIQHKIFHPQFHGREHVNVPMWLDLLQNDDETAKLAFKYNCWIIPKQSIHEKRNIQASYDALNDDEELYATQSVTEGLKLFKAIFNYNSKSFIANNFIWGKPIEKTLSDHDVQFIQGMKYQKYPLKYNPKNRKLLRHYIGAKNEFNQIYLIRNCVFEPSQSLKAKDEVKECLSHIKNAFFWKKPAIITSHRLNFIGALNEENRNQNLEKLDELLKQILIKWPDVEFMTSDELGKTIKASQN